MTSSLQNGLMWIGYSSATVSLSAISILIQWSQVDSISRYDLKTESSGRILRGIKEMHLSRTRRYYGSLRIRVYHYSIDLWMDECLAYHGYYRKTDDVF